jgi:Domain of Unknown Function (DUF928)
MRDGVRRDRQGIIGLTLVWLVCGILWGYGLPQPAEAQPDDTIIYKPPKRGAPGGREGAGTRGFREALPTLAVLAPQDHTGLTAQEQPVLYWYLSQETRHPVEVVLTDRQSVKPLLAIRLNPPLQPGMQRVRLADYNIRLTPGVLYKWSVALVRDAAQRSYDVLMASTIERVELPNELRGQLVRANKMTSARLYARAGLWYDTIAALSELIDTRPQDTALRQQRATVLEQEGLTAAAAYDRQYK